MKFKKVSGERIVAAILDSIIVGIIAGIPMVIFLVIEGFDLFMDFYVDGAGMVQTGDSYNLMTVISTVAGVVVGVIYFCYVPYKWNGQTLGKRVMNIKAIDEFGNNPTFKQHLIRGVQNWSGYVAIIMVPLLYVDMMLFSILTSTFTSVASLLVFAAFIMMLAKDDGKGLHDMFANTMVVKADIDLDKAFVEKTTQMSDWAEVDYGADDTKVEDDWFSKPTDTDLDKKDDEEDPWKY